MKGVIDNLLFGVPIFLTRFYSVVYGIVTCFMMVMGLLDLGLEVG